MCPRPGLTCSSGPSRSFHQLSGCCSGLPKTSCCRGAALPAQGQGLALVQHCTLWVSQGVTLSIQMLFEAAQVSIVTDTLLSQPVACTVSSAVQLRWHAAPSLQGSRCDPLPCSPQRSEA